MIKFSDDDEEFLDRIRSPPTTPPLSDDEDEKTLWYHDKSSHDQTVSITLCNPRGRHCFLAGETIEVDVVCTVKQLQLLSGVLEGFCVANGQIEETIVFQEVRLYPTQQQYPFMTTGLEEDEEEDELNTTPTPTTITNTTITTTTTPPTPTKGKRKSVRNGKNASHQSDERRFKFSLTIPLSSPPSLKINSKTGIFYRVRVCGIGEVPHYHVMPHHHYQGMLTPTRDASSPHLGGLGNFVPFRVRNNSCSYVNKFMLCARPQTSFSITCPVSGKDITLKVHLVGAAPYSVLGQLCTFFVKVENSTLKHTKGFTIKLVRHVHTISTSGAFIRGTNEEESSPDKCKTQAKFKFHSPEYHCASQGKLQSQIAILIPHSLTPTIATQNLHATYGLFVRVDVTPTHGLAHEMPLLVLPCSLDESSLSNKISILRSSATF